MAGEIMQARHRLFVALDMASVEDARRLVATLGEDVTSYKVGLELLFGGGLEFAQGLKAAGKTVFLDMKLLDIANTVEKAAANIARVGVDYLTVHGTDRKTLDAAVKGRGRTGLRLLAVTVLTSLDASDLVEQGIGGLTPAASPATISRCESATPTSTSSSTAPSCTRRPGPACWPRLTASTVSA